MKPTPLCLAVSLLLLAPEASAQARKLRRAPGPIQNVRVDAATGTVTRQPLAAQRSSSTVSDFPNLDLGGFVGIDTGGGAIEWFNDGVKGIAGNASDLMSSFVTAYCSSKLDPSLGGPGGTAKIGFYEGFTRNAPTPDGTAVAVLTLTGLPANSASSSFFGGFQCYFLQVDFTSLVSFADGPIGYSWKFLDLGTDGVFAGTFPLLASAGTCVNDMPVGTDPLGQEPYVCCSFAPADVYVNGVLKVVFTFAPYCLPYAMAMDIREVADLTATATPHAGDGVNVDVLSASPAIFGQPWSAEVTLNHAHGASGLAQFLVHTQAMNGPTLISPIGGRPYEVLFAGPRLGSVVVPHDGATSAPFSVQVPLELTLVGKPWTAQAIVVGGGFVDLSQAVQGVTGTR